jgi:hypothetical protein
MSAAADFVKDLALELLRAIPFTVWAFLVAVVVFLLCLRGRFSATKFAGMFLSFAVGLAAVIQWF